MRVLIVEDDRMVHSPIRRMVERQLPDCLVLEASNAADAALQLPAIMRAFGPAGAI